MTEQAFAKVLTANDTGESGGHQAGIHIPKSMVDLIRFLPPLDVSVKNPDAWLSCTDDQGCKWTFRYVYYNNRLHDTGGTRDEYRITHMTKFFRSVVAKSGDTFLLSGLPGSNAYHVCVSQTGNQGSDTSETKSLPRIRLRGWRRVH